MDQSLEVLWDSFYSFYILGVQICKNREKNIWGAVFIFHDEFTLPVPL